jgi:hypothetical protein
MVPPQIPTLNKAEIMTIFANLNRTPMAEAPIIEAYYPFEIVAQACLFASGRQSRWV